VSELNGTGRRMVLVHAHPDDESIGTGATMARYAAEGAGVTLITCTLGELGEIIPPDLAHLAADAGGGLGEYRIGELDAACAALGVTDHRFLGGPGRWRDSGMMGLPANDAPGSFWQADVDEAAGELLRVLREVRPQVLISYDDNGFYGHPDHIQAHRVARRAFGLADGLVAKFYATAVPRSALTAGIEEMRVGGADFTQVSSPDDLPFGVPDESFAHTPDDEVTTEIDGTAYLDRKMAAMRAHATQIKMRGTFFALSNNTGFPISGREHFTLLSGAQGSGSGPHGWETDVFAGIG
jgi:N-acetyl-1-D-myo-inositol-2-amino-2-deoxy-alpha-D-glucopyranoside deacetylase